MEIHAWCIMTNHVHLIFKSIANQKPELLLGDFKRFTSRDIDPNGGTPVNTIDDLVYTYHPDKKNQLMKVLDKSISPQGFNESQDTNSNGATDSVDDYDYDANGNMIKDDNKNITKIIYNHLNLPIEITFGTIGKINYLYNATGQKVKKTVTNGTTITTTDYLNGYQYLNAKLHYYPHAEGYVDVTFAPNNQMVSKYVFNYTDHLGNVRLSYTRNPGINRGLIIEENNYYAFGLKHSNYNVNVNSFSYSGVTTSGITKKYKYNGKELQEELGFNMYDYGARNYDATIGRWMNVDPLAEKSRRWSTYTYCYNNPLRFTDPDGMQADDVIIKGKEAQKAFEQLQKNTQGQLNLLMNDDGKVTATAVEGATLNEANQTLLNATTDQKITVVVDATSKNSVTTENGEQYFNGGAFMGSEVNGDGTVTANQTVNPNTTEKIDTISGQTIGTVVKHEILEAFIGAQQSPGSPNASVEGSGYGTAHKAATELDKKNINPAGALITNVPTKKGVEVRITNKNNKSETLYTKPKSFGK
jgi:RHS repeat-associated protein